MAPPADPCWLPASVFACLLMAEFYTHYRSSPPRFEMPNGKLLLPTDPAAWGEMQKKRDELARRAGVR